jgi:hypothetical protein
MKKSLTAGKTLLIVILVGNCLTAMPQAPGKLEALASERMKGWKNPLTQWSHIAKPVMDSVKIDQSAKRIILYFRPQLSYFPFREESIDEFEHSLAASLGRKFRKYKITVMAGGFSLEELVPNYYRKKLPVDHSRIPVPAGERPFPVRRISGYNPVSGLSGKSIALWHSHGYYFEMSLDRWEWQRARLFGTVEDISVMAYVLQYLVPMLERAGALVYLPRERDIQLREVIVDNDLSTGDSEVVLHLNDGFRKSQVGFLETDTLFPGDNPFRMGTSITTGGDSAVYIPEIPEAGYYSVHVSWKPDAENCREVVYSVQHTGGKTQFIINQTISGSTWTYLGTFFFGAGKNPGAGSVTIKRFPGSSGYLSLDAVRFGGGMGNTARRPSPEIIRNRQSASQSQSEKIAVSVSTGSDFSWKLSGVPRYLEGARYWLQYAGMPDSLVYSPNANKNDYNDDYQSRAEWVNYLKEKLGLPVDLSLAFHTDAGITPNDSIIGTLAIYSTAADSGRFSNRTSRLASRDFSDIVQTTVVDDIRKQFNAEWTRRGIWDRPYYEARKPDVPALLLELLSHQNLADQRFGLDPRFRFQVARSVYKGILRYISYTEDKQFIVQPLPVSNFAITPVSGKRIRLSWEPVHDSLEPSANPDRFVLYMRRGNEGFDNGTVLFTNRTELELDSFNTIYSFRVTAANEGGESLDSEILSVGLLQNDEKPVLVVNGFDRVCAPSMFDTGNMAGVAWWDDRGVADHVEITGTGDQYDYDRRSPWLDDDSPGWGASYNDRAGAIVAGNTFDYPYIHGKAIMSAGRSFFSVSDEHFCSAEFNPAPWRTVDLIFGEEKTTPFFNDTSKSDFSIYTPGFMNRVAGMTTAGTAIFMSGSYVGTDLHAGADSALIKFAARVLHFLPRTGHAVRSGYVYATDYAKPSFSGKISFNTGYSGSIYTVEAPDAIEPSGKGALCAFRYSESNASAGIIYKGSYSTVVLGFPFETITDENERNVLMKQILEHLKE